MKKIFSLALSACLSIAVSMFILTSCITKKEDLGETITKKVHVAPFRDIKVLDNATVYIIPSDTFGVVLKGKEGELKNIKVAVKGKTLVVSEERSIKRRNRFTFSFDVVYETPKIYVSMPVLNNVEISSNAYVEMTKPMTGNEVLLHIDGNASIEMAELTAKMFTLDVNGNASANMTKLTAEKANFIVAGNASIETHFDRTGEVKLEVTGNASADFSGTTLNAPEINIIGHASVNNNTTRVK